MSLTPQTLRAMNDELTKLAGSEEKLTSARRRQMLKDGIVTVGSMGVGWGVGKTLADSIANAASKSPKTRATVAKYAPAAAALVGTGIGLSLARQRKALRKRRDEAEKKSRGH